MPRMDGNIYPSIKDIVINQNGVEKLLSKLIDTKKACGPDIIPNIVLKEWAKELQQ